MARLFLWLYRILTSLLVPVAIVVLTIRDRIAGKQRPPWSERFVRSMPPVSPGGIWIHAVSVGEVEVARRILQEFPEDTNHQPVVLTATTATGLALARRTLGERAIVVASPLDLAGPVKRFFNAVRPSLLVLIETELWPELLHQAGIRDVPVAIVNARLSDSSYRGYRRIRRLLRPLLEPLTLVLTRDDTDARRFEALGVGADRVRVGGNIKYDLERDDRPLEWSRDLSDLAGDRAVFVAGSTMDGEENEVVRAVEELAKQGKSPFLILAPRHPERCEAVAQLLSERDLTTLRRSRWEAGDQTPHDVFLIDTIGELARAYKHATVAFIGGSLVPTGGHNPLEPAVWGVPVLTGPHVSNFKEVYRELIDAGGAQVVGDARDLASAVAAFTGDDALRQRVGSVGLTVIDSNRGATSRICASLAGLR